MENRNNIEKYNEQIKELFKEFADGEIYDTYADSFELDSIDGKTVLVAYNGEDIKAFKNECKDILSVCVASALGDGKKLKITKTLLSATARKNIKAVKFFVIGMVFVCIATAVVGVLFNYIGNRNFRETFYSASSIKVDSRVRVIQISDLHETSYGKNNAKLLERVKALAPDVIICTGDIVDSTEESLEFAVSLAEELAKIAPAYYVYGNNEVESIYGFDFIEKDLDQRFGFDETNRDENALLNIEDAFEVALEEAGVKVLKNEKDTIKVKTMNVDIYGVLNSNPSSFWSYSGNAFMDYLTTDTDNFKITAVHEPFIFETFSPDFWGDLMIAGHTHGGIVRVPVLGPLYTNEGGLFPARSGAFVYGRYDTAGRPLIISSGLENSNILRINNQPELVVIDINKF